MANEAARLPWRAWGRRVGDGAPFDGGSSASISAGSSRASSASRCRSIALSAGASICLESRPKKVAGAVSTALRASVRTYPNSGYDLEEVLTVLGTGGMGVVLSAFDPAGWVRF